MIEKLNVPVNQRAKFIGPGGINIKNFEMKTGVEITEENLGEFQIFAANKEALNEAMKIINEKINSQKEPVLEFGAIYTATITEIREHGCMVILYPAMQPVLIPVTQLDHKKVFPFPFSQTDLNPTPTHVYLFSSFQVSHPSALNLKVGDQFKVKYFGRDPISGYMRLSRKVLHSPPSNVAQNFFETNS